MTTAPSLPQPQPLPLGTAAAKGPIGEILLRRGVISPQQLAEAVVRQAGTSKRIGTVLQDLGMVGERDLIVALADQLNLQLVDLATVTPDPAVARLLKESVARGLRAIPVWREADGTIVVAACDPSAGLQQELQGALNAPVKIVLGTTNEVLWAIDQTFPALANVGVHVAAFTAQHGIDAQLSATVAAAEGGETPVVRISEMLLTQAIRDRASDIHIEPHDDGVRVRFRIDGVLRDVLSLPAAIGPALCSRLKILAGMSIVERRRPQDGQIALMIDRRAIDIRVSTVGVIGGEKIVMRLLDKSRGLLTMEDLGMGIQARGRYEGLLRSPFGMILCAGPTGSGKTTTLYASLNEISTPELNVTAIEDPVEYVNPSINQIQVNEAAGISFAGTLRAVLRQDPDVILVGEIRDVETATIAVQAALTGHFVLSSVHATDAVSTLYRFIDMGIEPFLIAASLIGIVGQRLVRRTCDHCKMPYQPTRDELQYYRMAGGDPNTTFTRGMGCNYCSQTGFAGRTGVYELLVLTPELKEIVVGPRTTHSVISQVARKQGMRSLAQEGAALVAQGRTTINEIIRAIYTL